jgi:hypothetical protein
MSSRHQRGVGTRALLTLAAVLVAVAPAPRAACAQAPPEAGLSLRGRVIDRASALAIRDAEVVLARLGRRTRTDSVGAFRFEGLPAGPHEVMVRVARFGEVSFTAELRAGHDPEYLIHLDATAGAAQELAPVAVTGEAAPPVSYRLVDFERRRRTGRGQYLTLEEIERSGASTVPDLTRGMRGVTTHCGGGGGCRLQMVRAPNGCAPEYVVDGRTDNMFGAQTPIRDIVGMELYTGPSDVPGEFAGRNAGCGVVVLWTRAGPDRRPKKEKGRQDDSR